MVPLLAGCCEPLRQLAQLHCPVPRANRRMLHVLWGLEVFRGRQTGCLSFPELVRIFDACLAPADREAREKCGYLDPCQYTHVLPFKSWFKALVLAILADSLTADETSRPEASVAEPPVRAGGGDTGELQSGR